MELNMFSNIIFTFLYLIIKNEVLSDDKCFTQCQEESSYKAENGVVIGAATGGGVVFITILTVTILIVLLKSKRKQKTEEDDYYITENPAYGEVTKQQHHEPTENYDEITSDNLKHQSVIYSVVDKSNIDNKNGGVAKQQTDEEDEYNHLNDLPKSVVTGNLYSSIRRRGSQPTANIYNSVSASQKEFGSKDNIYNTSEEAF